MSNRMGVWLSGVGGLAIVGCAWHTDTEDDKKLQGKVDKLRDALRDIASDERGRRILKSIGVAIVNESIVADRLVLRVGSDDKIEVIDLLTTRIADLLVSLSDH